MNAMKNSLHLQRALVLFVLLHAFIEYECKLVQALASPSPSQGNKNTTIVRSKKGRQIDFSGSSSHQIQVKPEISQGTGRGCQSLPNWLASARSHPHLLGSDDVSQNGDGTYTSVLPALEFFGMELVPTFVQRISLQNNKNKEAGVSGSNSKDSLSLNVSIEDSSVNASQSSRIGNLVERVMKTCSFQGSNELTCTPISGTNGEEYWELSSDFTLNMQFYLGSRLMVLPPGFNTIGSRIVERTVKKRVKDNLLQLAEKYRASCDNDLSGRVLDMVEENCVAEY